MYTLHVTKIVDSETGKSTRKSLKSGRGTRAQQPYIRLRLCLQIYKRTLLNLRREKVAHRGPVLQSQRSICG